MTNFESRKYFIVLNSEALGEVMEGGTESEDCLLIPHWNNFRTELVLYGISYSVEDPGRTVVSESGAHVLNSRLQEAC